MTSAAWEGRCAVLASPGGHWISNVDSAHYTAGDRRGTLGPVCLNEATNFRAAAVVSSRLNGVPKFRHILQFACHTVPVRAVVLPARWRRVFGGGFCTRNLALAIGKVLKWITTGGCGRLCRGRRCRGLGSSAVRCGRSFCRSAGWFAARLAGEIDTRDSQSFQPEQSGRTCSKTRSPLSRCFATQRESDSHGPLQRRRADRPCPLKGVEPHCCGLILGPAYSVCAAVTHLHLLPSGRWVRLFLKENQPWGAPPYLPE